MAGRPLGSRNKTYKHWIPDGVSLVVRGFTVISQRVDHEQHEVFYTVFCGCGAEWETRAEWLKNGRVSMCASCSGRLGGIASSKVRNGH